MNESFDKKSFTPVERVRGEEEEQPPFAAPTGKPSQAEKPKDPATAAYQQKAQEFLDSRQ